MQHSAHIGQAVASVSLRRTKQAVAAARRPVSAVCRGYVTGRVESPGPRMTTPPGIDRWLLDIGLVRRSPLSAITLRMGLRPSSQRPSGKLLGWAGTGYAARGHWSLAR